jgi:hypothetical protein
VHEASGMLGILPYLVTKRSWLARTDVRHKFVDCGDAGV